MDTSPKNVREHIARSKFFLQRKDILKSLKSLALALELLGSGQIFGRERIEIDVLMEEAVRLVVEQEGLKAAFPAGTAYKKGKERELSALFSRVATALEAVFGRARKEERRKQLAELDELILAGQAELDQGQPMEARKHFRRAVEICGDEPGLYADLGNRFFLAGLLAEAVEYLLKNIEVAPGELRPYPLLAQCYDSLGDADKAEDIVRAALRRFGPMEAMNLRLAKGALERRNWGEALTNAQAVLKLNATNQEALKLAATASQHIYGDPLAYQREDARPSREGVEVKLDL
ncbi:MAG: tetratricopeptide repeat protein [Humidesulfovibrio sp.]|uniref:tetratricopeptide repeat protein n=1 Tax=Humidesulfovibrio sp. TaxID=2910988 RepID=UPI0027EE67A4|nr:tetratricopeptide repeat protein [Humidesulfovibrio sp.]MDQ7835174.1 tetratricopeptide repeat protein [Humidesulfovibrio sp.]